jgi:hypothetical protein
MANIHSLLSDGTNLIEIYFTKKIKDPYVIDTNISDAFTMKVMETFSNWKKTEYTSFYKNDLVYTYDMSNDNQIVFSKIKQMDRIVNKKNNNLYFISYKHSKIPTHIFPCTCDIDDRVTYTIDECRLSNRLSIILKKDSYSTSLFIEYRHSPQVELEKIESRINSVIDTFSKIDISL